MDPAISAMIEHYGVTEQTLSFINRHQQMFINGEFVEGSSNARIDVVEPSTAVSLTRPSKRWRQCATP